jgi:beta-aspartyl-dipeptidase (metallo-type)
MLILRNAEVYAPQPLGRRDVVVAGERIVALAPSGVRITGFPVEEHDLNGAVLTPGFIDNHVHVLGGGGGLGFASRAPELQMSQLATAGITTVIGMLGFDATTKSMESLVARTKAFWQEGISAYALTGATLEHPVPTLTGRIRTDIAFIEEIIGVGEVSVSELGYGFDSNGPGAQYIAEAATAALLAGRLSGKRGVLCLQVPPHVGACLKPVMTMIDRTGLPISQFIASHVNQSASYMEDAVRWGRSGGWVDVGANYSPENNYERALPPAKAVGALREAGVPLERILVSSDGNGAPPKEEKGEAQPAGANYMPVSALADIFRRLVLDELMQPDEALAVVTANPASALGLATKGRIAPGLDADMIVFSADWRIDKVIARGRLMVAAGAATERGMFEETILAQLSHRLQAPREAVQ